MSLKKGLIDQYQQRPKHGETSIILVSSDDDFFTPSPAVALIFSPNVRNTLIYSVYEWRGGTEILGLGMMNMQIYVNCFSMKDLSHDSCYLSGCPSVFI